MDEAIDLVAGRVVVGGGDDNPVSVTTENKGSGNGNDEDHDGVRGGKIGGIAPDPGLFDENAADTPVDADPLVG